MPTERPVLFQFTASHFNEKARWALDWKRVDYEKRSLLPGLHAPRVALMTGQRTVPVLLLDGKAIADSTRIIAAVERRWPEPALYPSDPAERERALGLEEWFDEELGPHVRRVLFDAILADGDYTCALFSHDASPMARRFYRASFPLVRSIMRADMQIRPETAAASRAKMDEALQRITDAVGPSGFLVGDRFSIADLTAAALLAPLVQPAEFPYAWPAPPPEPARQLREAYTSHPGFRWAAELYRTHRVHPASR